MALALILFGVGAFILLYVWAKFYLWALYVGAPAADDPPHMLDFNHG